MPVTVQTEIRLRGDAKVTHVGSFTAVDIRNGKEPREVVDGMVVIGEDRDVTLTGTATDLRSFARAIEEAAMELERLDADARIAHHVEQVPA